MHGDDILANIKERTTYSLECAALCKTKNGETICGDQAIGFTGSKSKYYLLLADGMGCGKDAFLQSELIIKTLKKLIKGGLSVVSALNTYRSITRINESFGFSTIDICAIDLNNGNTELYKAGAFDSFLLSNGRCFLFSGGGIPLGLTDTDRIKHETIKLHHEDYLILASDGLISHSDHIERILLDSKDEDVRSFAKKILYTHSEQNPEHSDDVTVMVCKIKKTEE
jgi:stage II sporulation protein E